MKIQHLLFALMLESIHDLCIFKALIIVSPPGGGKTTIVSFLKDGTLPHSDINIDPFYEHLLNKNEFTSTESFNKARTLLINKLRNHFNSMLPLYIQTTASDLSLLQHRLSTLTALGYDYGFVIIDVDKSVASTRVIERNSASPRKIPESDITELMKKYYHNIKIIDSEYKSKILTRIDNNSDVLPSSAAAFISHSRSVNRFFKSPVTNPIGVHHINELRTTGMQYLNDVTNLDHDTILKMVTQWI